jgi:hypothetical protein
VSRHRESIDAVSEVADRVGASAEWGDNTSVELDAIEPNRLRKLVKYAINIHMTDDAREELQRFEADTASGSWSWPGANDLRAFSASYWRCILSVTLNQQFNCTRQANGDQP